MRAKKRIKTKKKVHKKKNKLLLDTSIQIQKYFNPDLKKLLDSLKSKNELASSFFVLYEFKIGLVCNLIDFYLRVKLSNKSIADAIVDWSNSFKIRELKNKILLEAAMLRIHGSVDATSKEKYLSQVEAIILYFLVNFDSDLNKMTGSFENDEIVKYKINNRNDYKGFLEAYKKRQCIPLEKFWEDNLVYLDKFIGEEAKFKKGRYKKFHDKLVKIKEDFKNANMVTVNKGVGDAVIAVDCSKSYAIGTLDKLFEILCDCVDKNLYLIDKDNKLYIK